VKGSNIIPWLVDRLLIFHEHKKDEMRHDKSLNSKENKKRIPLLFFIGFITTFSFSSFSLYTLL